MLAVNCNLPAKAVALVIMRGFFLLAMGLVVATGCATDRAEERADQVVAAQRRQPGQATVTSSQAAPPSAAAPEREEPVRYWGLPQTHWVTAVRDRGARVELEDRSVWEIAVAYRADTAVWLVGQKITVTETFQRDFPYRLTNADRDNFADATLVSAPAP